MSMSLETAQRVAELAQERVGLLERLADVEREMGSMMTFGEGEGQVMAPRPVASSAAKKGSKSSNGGGITVIGKGRSKAADSESKPPDLPTLLGQIAAEQKKPLKLADFVALARAAGYKPRGKEESEAKDFPNMVYQALLKLVKRGVLEKDQESRDYIYVGQAA